MNEQSQLAEMLSPQFKDGTILVVETHVAWNVEDRASGRLTSRKSFPWTGGGLRQVRGNITRTAGYYNDRTQNHTAIYEYDLENSRWKLIDLVLKDTHKDDFPWRRKRKKSDA